MVEHAEEEGTIREIEKDLIGNIFDFDDIQVKEIMIPRAQMDILSAITSVKGAMKVFLKHAHSRMPVYNKRERNIIGIVFIKDLIKLYHEGKNPQVKTIMHKPYFVHERKRISGLLRIFQKAGRSHMAVAVNEYGRVTGLVTMEDVLEEIVGEIMDETDKIAPHVDKVTRNTWMVDGDTDVDELKDKTGLKIPEGEYDTFGEFLVKLFKKLPRKDDEISYRNYSIIIEKVAKKKIEQVKVVKA
jgi:CBS domain containing-hemolysin-like protein